MKISKDSWHYKALTQKLLLIDGKSKYQVSKSLCGYFWQMVWRIASVFGIYAFALSPLVFWATLLLEIPDQGFLHVALTFFGVFASCFYAFFGIAWVCVVLLENVINPLVDKLSLRRHGDKQPNIFTEYVKAKKDKVCPVLEFTDGE